MFEVWHASLCLLMETLAWGGEGTTRTLCNPVVLCSSEKWHRCTSYRHLRSGTSSGPWKRIQRDTGERGSGGIPADPRAEGTVTWVSLLCRLGPILFIFCVTLRSLQWGRLVCWTPALLAGRGFAVSPALLGTTACTAVTRHAGGPSSDGCSLFSQLPSFLNDKVGPPQPSDI